MLPAAISKIIDAERPLLLDGGLGGELARRGFDLDSPLWSAELIRRDPDALRSVHRAYLDAGAGCITTASYQASIPGLQAQGLSPAQIAAVFRRSVEIAAEARDEFAAANGVRPLIAASIGPYGAYLADGSEYRGRYGLDDAGLRDFHRPRLELLDEAGADLIACETMPDLQELRVLRELLDALDTPAWVSFCCRDEHSLHDGSPVEAAAELFADGEQPFAIGVNCCSPSIVEALIGRLRAAAPGRAIVVYPNSGGQYDAETKNWRGDRALNHWSRLARDWFRAGAGIIGGCCQIGPEYIGELASIDIWHS